jgi:hypothetical protein
MKAKTAMTATAAVRTLAGAVVATGLVVGAAITPAYAVERDEVAPAAVVRFQAEARAYPVAGRSGVFADPGHEVRVWEYANVVTIDAATWDGRDVIRMEWRSPDGGPLGPGAFQQGQAPETLRTLVVHGGLGCAAPALAAVVVDRIDRDEAGALTALDATFEHRCAAGPDTAFRGQVHFRA